jgi:hypothetical protein
MRKEEIGFSMLTYQIKQKDNMADSLIITQALFEELKLPLIFCMVK